MQDQNNTPPALADSAAAANAAVSQAAQGDFIKKIVDKIRNSENILIVLSRTPSVDEIAAALGLAMFLDGMQKHTTAVYSGRVPDNLAFLQPMETFEQNTDSLQDFIISLNKDKADHLRYKLEGDDVKVFITPYKSIITEDDLTFSHGDYNVDFVIALNVASSGQLDHALREHSRIMRDASVVNITAGEPGKFGEIEWTDSTASSLCEMITKLIFALQESDEKPLEHDIATSLLAGIVAATERFSNSRTNPDTLGIASKLMAIGADQQLITSNISTNDIIDNTDEFAAPNTPREAAPRSSLEITHDEPESINPYVNGSINPYVNNPAAAIAPNPNLDTTPTPTTMINNTNDVTPESVVVQPIIPGAPANTAPATNPGQMQIPNLTPAAPNVANTPTAPNNPTPAPATPEVANPNTMQLPNVASDNTVPTNLPDPSQMQIPGVSPNPTVETAPTDNTHNILTGEPSTPTTKQVGNTITPPTPQPKTPKNYAEMMEAALQTPAEATPENNAAPAQPAAPMEPVTPPSDTPVLPPPPAPGADTSGMMPPVLPPVQLPPQS